MHKLFVYGFLELMSNLTKQTFSLAIKTMNWKFIVGHLRYRKLTTILMAITKTAEIITANTKVLLTVLGGFCSGFIG